MEKYDYKAQIKEDIKSYLKENELVLNEDTQEEIHDTLWLEDSVTGNASGSYYCNAWKAEEAIAHNWDIIGDMVSDGWLEAESLTKGAEYLDVCIRCYLLAECIGELINE